MKSKKMWLFAIPVVILIIVGGFMFKQKTEEERRNREYEVSLVKALKNSYAGIEEIKITKPHYTEIPGSWTCFIKLKFKDKKEIDYYKVNYKLKTQRLSDVSLERSDRMNDRQYLNEHRGKTLNKIKVIYSDSEEGTQ